MKASLKKIAAKDTKKDKFKVNVLVWAQREPFNATSSLSPPHPSLVINQIWLKQQRGGEGWWGSRDRGMNEGFKILEDLVFVRVRGQGARQDRGKFV